MGEEDAQKNPIPELRSLGLLKMVKVSVLSGQWITTMAQRRRGNLMVVSMSPTRRGVESKVAAHSR